MKAVQKNYSNRGDYSTTCGNCSNNGLEPATKELNND